MSRARLQIGLAAALAWSPAAGAGDLTTGRGVYPDTTYPARAASVYRAGAASLDDLSLVIETATDPSVARLALRHARAIDPEAARVRQAVARRRAAEADQGPPPANPPAAAGAGPGPPAPAGQGGDTPGKLAAIDRALRALDRESDRLRRSLEGRPAAASASYYVHYVWTPLGCWGYPWAGVGPLYPCVLPPALRVRGLGIRATPGGRTWRVGSRYGGCVRVGRLGRRGRCGRR